jgi:hypothetical protein
MNQAELIQLPHSLYFSTLTNEANLYGAADSPDLLAATRREGKM